MIPRRPLLCLAGLAALPAATGAAAGTVVELRAADGMAVVGEQTAATTPRRRGTILLFHQAGSNLGEYATIAPELARRGFDSLAIDQRSGGTGWGRRNQTAAQAGRDFGFRDALPDLEAALLSVRQPPRPERATDARGNRWEPRDPGPILAWGSSYSAALVFLLAAAQPLAGILAFSPGEYFPGVREAAARVTCPVFVSSAADPQEENAAAVLLAATHGSIRQQFRPNIGPHGSSLLRPDRNPRGAAAAWAAVDGFLDAAVPR